MFLDPALAAAAQRHAHRRAYLEERPKTETKEAKLVETQSPGAGADVDGGSSSPAAAQASRKQADRLLLKIVVLGCANVRLSTFRWSSFCLAFSGTFFTSPFRISFIWQVGKTSLMKRYVANDFVETRRATIGSDFMTREITVGDQPVLLQIWDTAGQERFHHGALGPGFFRGANAALLVYDVTSAKSFEQVAMWREELLVRLDADPERFPIVVIGNKVDLAESVGMDGIRGVDRDVVLKWCKMQGMGHVETSAKDGTGVQAAMEVVAALAVAQRRRRDEETAKQQTELLRGRIDLGRQQRHANNGCCR
ncbi:unnamed protein product [Phaeothamnion confervicola]